MNDLTEVLQYKLDDLNASASVTPIYQCSAFSSDSPYFYSRKNNPNVVELENVVAMLEKAKHALAYSCGMSAEFLILDLLSPGDTLVINKLLYGCSYKLFQRLSKRRGFQVVVLDLCNEKELEKIPESTKMIFFETPTNPFLKTIEIAKIKKYAQSKNPAALIVVDNTWATPLYQKPLQHGADISLHSGTKYFSGHSDVMGGVILVENDDLYETLKADRFYAGAILTPYHAWLMRRSIQTLGIRLDHQTKVTQEMREFLKKIPLVRKVYHPEIDGKQLVNYGGILFIELKEEFANKYDEFKKHLKLFQTGTGMACVTSMVAQPYSGSHASMNDKEKEEMGIHKGLIRLCFGLEDSTKLKADLLQAFKQIEQVYETIG